MSSGRRIDETGAPPLSARTVMVSAFAPHRPVMRPATTARVARDQGSREVKTAAVLSVCIAVLSLSYRMDALCPPCRHWACHRVLYPAACGLAPAGSGHIVPCPPEAETQHAATPHMCDVSQTRCRALSCGHPGGGPAMRARKTATRRHADVSACCWVSMDQRRQTAAGPDSIVFISMATSR